MVAQDLTARNFLASFGFKKTTNFKGNQLSVGRSFKLSCLVDREMDVSTSALVDGVAECLNGMCGCHIAAIKIYDFVNSIQIYGFSSYLWLICFVGCRNGGEGAKYFNNGTEF